MCSALTGWCSSYMKLHPNWKYRDTWGLWVVSQPGSRLAGSANQTCDSERRQWQGYYSFSHQASTLIPFSCPSYHLSFHLPCMFRIQFDCYFSHRQHDKMKAERQNIVSRLSQLMLISSFPSLSLCTYLHANNNSAATLLITVCGCALRSSSFIPHTKTMREREGNEDKTDYRKGVYERVCKNGPLTTCMTFEKFPLSYCLEVRITVKSR